MIVKLLVLVICVHNVVCLFILLIKRQLVASETEQSINSTSFNNWGICRFCCCCSNCHNTHVQVEFDSKQELRFCFKLVLPCSGYM